VTALADAYVWGYPLVTMHRACARHGGVGRGLIARHRLATPAERTVVAPNNDTLYASGWFDLRHDDLTVSVGPMDRYWSVMLLDAYTHVSYICRRLHGNGGVTVRVTYDPTAPPTVDEATEVVRVGTPTVWVLARVLATGVADADALARITVFQAGGRTTAGPPAEDGFFAELQAALAVDPPASWHPAPPAGLHELRGRPDDATVAEGRRRMARSSGVDRTGNGWGTRSRGADFGDDVTYRAAFARVSLAGHLPAENRSYSRRFDGSTHADLRFPPSGEPPVKGFWSLCVYGQDLFLVDNEIDRYSIGDRTPGLLRDEDGSVSITLGHERPAATANWLPTPDGPCVLTLRAYEGHDDVVSARWFPPDLQLR